MYILGINHPEHKVYVGKTSDLQERMQSHRSGTGGGTGSKETSQQSTSANLPVWLIGAVELPFRDAMTAYELYMQDKQFGKSPDPDFNAVIQAKWDAEKWTERIKLDNTACLNIDADKIANRRLVLRKFNYTCSGKHLGVEYLKEKAAEWLLHNPSPAVQLELNRDKCLKCNPYTNNKVPKYFPHWAARKIQRVYRPRRWRRLVLGVEAVNEDMKLLRKNVMIERRQYRNKNVLSIAKDREQKMLADIFQVWVPPSIRQTYMDRVSLWNIIFEPSAWFTEKITDLHNSLGSWVA